MPKTKDSSAMPTKRKADSAASTWIGSEEMGQLEAHGLYLLEDDPRMKTVFAKVARKPCLKACGKCIPCRARSLRRASAKKGRKG